MRPMSTSSMGDVRRSGTERKPVNSYEKILKKKEIQQSILQYVQSFREYTSVAFYRARLFLVSTGGWEKATN